MLFLTGLELASKSQASTCLRLTSAGITSTCPNAGLCSYMGSGTSDYPLQTCFFLSYHFSCPREYFSFSLWSCHQTPDNPPPTPPCEDGDRGILPAALLSLSATDHLQELPKAPRTKSTAERSEWDFALSGFPFRNRNKIWLVRRTEPALEELASGPGGKCELWRVCLWPFPATWGAKCAFLFLFVRDWRPAPCFLWSTDLENIDLHGIPEAPVKLMWFS